MRSRWAQPPIPISRSSAKQKITRSLLEVFARKQGYRLGIVTKSNLIDRDIDLLAEIAPPQYTGCPLTITTPDAELARKLEPRAPRPDLRFAAVRHLREAGITAGSPVLPAAARHHGLGGGNQRHGAQGSGGWSKFLRRESALPQALLAPHLLQLRAREHFPALLNDYEVRFGAADFATPAYSPAAREDGREGLPAPRAPPESQDALLTRDLWPRAPELAPRRWHRANPSRSAVAARGQTDALRLVEFTVRGWAAGGGAPCVKWCSRNSWNSVPNAPSATPSSVFVTVTCTLC